MRLMVLVLVMLCMTGCFKQTRVMQEQTKVNLVAQTPIGEIRVTGVVDRVQNEKTEFNVVLPPLLQAASGAVTSYLTGAGGIAAMAYAWYATRSKRLKLEEAARDKESNAVRLAAQRDHYLREICHGVAMYLREVGDTTGERLKHHLAEAMSKDTRDAVRDFK